MLSYAVPQHFDLQCGKDTLSNFYLQITFFYEVRYTDKVFYMVFGGFGTDEIYVIIYSLKTKII